MLWPRAYGRWVLFICYLLAYLRHARTVARTETLQPSASGLEADGSDWENLNYYQLLGLDPDKDIDDVQIRKAYRAQAKRYHPDKLATQNTTKDAMQNINSRFAKIAEAYQVLSDSSKRSEYDRFLQYERRMKETGSFSSASAPEENWSADSSFFSSWFGSDESFDPFAVFDMVFGTDMSSSFGSTFDPTSLFAEQAQMQGHHSRHSHPIRTFQEQFEFVDEFGQIVRRLRQTEEYSDSFYRVMEQDFVEDWDPYHRQWVFVPLQPYPVVVDEGWPMNHQHGSDRADLSFDGRGPQWLWPGTILIPGILLENPPYQAGLTQTCELVVTEVALGEDADELQVTWSSGAAFGGLVHQGCGLWLEGQRLVVATLSHPPYVIWYSRNEKAEDDIDDAFMDQFIDPQSHAARLDDDGSLSVYRLEPPSDFWKQANQLTRVMPLLQKLLARIGGLTVLPSSTSQQVLRTVCVYSTSPVGCFREGRLILRLVRGVRRMVNQMIQIILT